MSANYGFPDFLPADWLAAFVLVLARMGGLVGVAPGFASSAVPLSARAALAAALALLVAPAQRQQVVVPAAAIDFVVLCVQEAGIGALMGMSIAALMSGVRAAGQLAEQQTGLALGEIFDPKLDQSDAVLRRFYALVAIVLFLLLGGHRMLVSTVLDSFKAVPVGGAAVPDSAVAAMSTLVGQSFQIALRVAAPVVVTLLLAGVTLGFLARTTPQLQLLVTALPIRVLVGLFVLGAALACVAALVSEQTYLFLNTLRESLDGVVVPVSQ
jgi:flagellar biosynthetic protein FliR